MAVTINFASPEEQAAVEAQAAAEGLGVEEWLAQIARERVRETTTTGLDRVQAPNLADLLRNSPLAGADLNLKRAVDYPSAIELE